MHLGYAPAVASELGNLAPSTLPAPLPMTGTQGRHSTGFPRPYGSNRLSGFIVSGRY